MKIREKMMTRTVTTILVKTLGINAENAAEIREIEIPEIESKKILPYLMENATEDFTPAKVISCSTIERLYALSESDFLKYAHEIPKRNNNKEEG